MAEDDYSPAPGVICPQCGSLFVDEKFDESMPTKDPERQAHAKGLEHFSENHQDWLSENNAFPGLIPVEMKVLKRFYGSSSPRKLKDVMEGKP